MFESNVQGIPCLVNITYYEDEEPDSWDCPGHAAEAEFDIYDRKGYRARWLEDKMTNADARRIHAECCGSVTEARADAKLQAQIDRWENRYD